MKKTLNAEDLFVLLERAFRRRTRGCDACKFTLPFRTDARASGDAWSIVPSADCSSTCQLILEDLVAEHQQAYRLR